MKKFKVDWELNTYGADTLELFYEGINSQYPELGLTVDNSTILLVQALGGIASPQTAITRIQKGTDRGDVYELTYDRQSVSELIEQPVLDEADLEAIKDITDSEVLLDYIAKKYDLALTAKDIWVEIAGIQNTGGEVQPNWRMKSRYNSLGWYGEVIVWLHPGP